MKLSRLFPILILCAAMTACFRTPTEIEIKQDRIDIYDANGTVSLAATVKDKKGKTMEKAKPKYSSDDASIASVDAAGKVTAKSSGNTNINVQYKKLSKTIPVTVMIVDKLKLEYSTPGIYEAMGPEKSAFQLSVTAKNERGEDVDPSVLKMSSSDPGIATVNEKGEMTLLGDGTAKITVSVGKQKASLDVPVTVLRPSAVKVDSPRFVVGVGQTAYLPYTIISTKGTPLIMFPVKVEFEKEGLATADEVGQVTGVAKGTTNVTVRAGEATNTLTLTVR